MREPLRIDAQVVCQLARLSGFDLPLDRAVVLVSGLQEILEIDARIARLDLGTMTVIGVPWISEATADDEH